MSFILTEEQEELLALVRKFSEKEILPYAHQMDVEAHFVPGLIQKIADLGFMGINVPEEYGGVGADEVTFLDITATHEGRLWNLPNMMPVLQNCWRFIHYPVTLS